MIAGREVDFLINDYVLEIGNHTQDSTKNKMLLGKGYRLMTLSNREIYNKKVNLEKFLLKWINKN